MEKKTNKFIKRHVQASDPCLRQLYNTAIAGVPYDDFPDRNEYWYRLLFSMLLKGAEIVSYAEVHTSGDEVICCFSSGI